MHVYIYDDFVNTKKYENTLANIETRITDLGLNGKIIRLGVMKNAHDAIVNEVKRGAKTIVAVGNNQTINKVVDALAKSGPTTVEGENTPLGIIPIGEKNNEIATALGVGKELEACDIISARRIETLDLGQANQSYFLAQAVIPSKETSVEISQNYSIEIMEPGKILIINLLLLENCQSIKSSPQDGKIELYIKAGKEKGFFSSNKKTSHSLFSLKKLTVTNKKYPLLLDFSQEVTTPAQINILKRKLKIIVGKHRNF